MYLLRHFITSLLICKSVCHEHFSLLNCNGSLCFEHLESNHSWFGPVAVTSKPGVRINFAWDISIPTRKCCPGLVTLTNTNMENIIQINKRCLNISLENLEFLYNNDNAFKSLSYGVCVPPGSKGIYTCRGHYYIRSQFPIHGAVYLFYPCEQMKDLEMTYNIRINTGPLSGSNDINECIDLGQHKSVCSNYYKYGYLPNLLGWSRMENIVTPNIARGLIQCHKHFEEFMCRLIVPECREDGFYISPCQSLVKEILQYACQDILLKFLNHHSSSHGDRNFMINYYVCKFPTTEPCYDVNVTCDEPPAIKHGTYTIHTGLKDAYPLNTTAVYSCGSGYELKGESTSQCRYSGKWNPIPSCRMMSIDKTKEIVIACSLSFVVLTIIIVSILIIKYRQEIAIILYVKYGFSLRTLKEVQRKYDAFIAYNLHDISFVKYELLRRLENADPPYSVCIHHRDL